MRTVVLVIMILSTDLTSSFSQEVFMIEYDFTSKESTLIDFGESNITESSKSTISYIPDLGNTIELVTTIPTNNFSRLNNVEKISSYPISTSVKIVSVKNGEPECNCSGTMISKRHILSAAHCFLEIGTNNITSDTLWAFPGFNNGEENSIYKKHLVMKAYSFSDWSLNGNDFIVLELSNDIGMDTGWLAIGFNDDANQLSDKLYHKFSYPCSTEFINIEENINGDTLYYSYGLFDKVDEYISSQYLDIPGILGESGSSIFLNNYNNQHIIYGVLTWRVNFKHSKIDEWEFWGIQKIIESHLSSTIEPDNPKINVYPNPAVSYLNIDLSSFSENASINIYNNMGELLFTKKANYTMNIDISNWPSGFYYIEINSKNKSEVKKVVKYGR